jgi:hypothetical protein
MRKLTTRHSTRRIAFRFAFRSIVAALALGTSIQATADCAGASISDTKKAYAMAQSLERSGKLREALGAYVAAQEYTCEPNPVELSAAQRASAIALPLGRQAEQNKDFEAAFRLYDDGAHFAAADRALMALVRAKPDSPSVFNLAREKLEYRASPAFQSNNKVRLAVTGRYVPNPQHLVEVQAMPAIGADRAFKAEATAFNEQNLRDYVELVQLQPDDPMDQVAMQRFLTSQQSFHQRWPNDLLKESREALSLAHAWSSATSDRALGDKIAARRRERLEQRVVTITRAFHRAPKLLDAAIDYQMSMHIEESVKQSRAASIRSQAASLGDQAISQKRFGLATEYYRVARLDNKADAAQEQQRQIAMAKMQPSIDQMRKQAEQMQKDFSDPAKVKAMQEQAREMQKAMQAQQQANAKTRAKNADDLENELGL